MIPAISDPTMRALQASIAGLDTRSRAIQNNIANVETPGYQAQVVNFEDSLAEAMEAGDAMGMETSVASSMAPTRLNGNNVAIDSEMTQLTETELRHQLSIAALNAKYSLLRTAITGM